MLFFSPYNIWPTGIKILENSDIVLESFIVFGKLQGTDDLPPNQHPKATFNLILMRH